MHNSWNMMRVVMVGLVAAQQFITGELVFIYLITIHLEIGEYNHSMLWLSGYY